MLCISVVLDLLPVGTHPIALKVGRSPQLSGQQISLRFAFLYSISLQASQVSDSRGTGRSPCLPEGVQGSQTSSAARPRCSASCHSRKMLFVTAVCHRVWDSHFSEPSPDRVVFVDVANNQVRAAAIVAMDNWKAGDRKQQHTCALHNESTHRLVGQWISSTASDSLRQASECAQQLTGSGRCLCDLGSRITLAEGLIMIGLPAVRTRRTRRHIFCEEGRTFRATHVLAVALGLNIARAHWRLWGGALSRTWL